MKKEDWQEQIEPSLTPEKHNKDIVIRSVFVVHRVAWVKLRLSKMLVHVDVSAGTI